MQLQEARRQLEGLVLPTHIGIIMDGNGRWAKKRGLPRSQGHRQGAKTFQNIAEFCGQLGIPYLTVYAFSTENWKRPQAEVDELMRLLRSYLGQAQRHAGERVCLKVLGELSVLPEDMRRQIAHIEEQTKGRTGIQVNIAFNYGGRDELVHAFRSLARRVQAGELTPEAIDESSIASQLYTAGMPDPDLIIRPSGEQRSSNFLLWQAAYAEYLFMDVLWPDFTDEHLVAALREYAARNRRFGGL